MNVGAQPAVQSSDRFGSSTGPVWLRDVQCSGIESNLTQCVQNVMLRSSAGCSYIGSRDANVSCLAGELNEFNEHQ